MSYWRPSTDSKLGKNGLFLVGESSGVQADGRKWIEFRCTAQPADRYPVKSAQRAPPPMAVLRPRPPTAVVPVEAHSAPKAA